MLFEIVFYGVCAIQDDNDKLAKSIWDDLKIHKDNVGNSRRTWEMNATALEGRTPYGFLGMVEGVLHPPGRPTPGHEPRTPVGARDMPNVNWANLISKTKEIGGKKIYRDLQRKDAMLDNLEIHIHKRKRELAEKLMKIRDSTVQFWKDELERLDASEKRHK
jgi:hypothetical protein